MKRRDFIQKSSVYGAGALALAQLPLSYGMARSHQSTRSILCVLAGVSRTDFTAWAQHYFPSSSSLIKDMRYKGQVAGHYIALQSILHGKYLNEKEAISIKLTDSPLLRNHESHYLLISSVGQQTSPASAMHVAYSVWNEHPTETALNKTTAQETDMQLCQRLDEVVSNEKIGLVVAQFMGTDIAHTDIGKAKAHLAHLGKSLSGIWAKTEKSLVETQWLIVPDFGRNDFPNSYMDEEGRLGLDHHIHEKSTQETACFISNNHRMPNASGISESVDICPFLMDVLS